MFGPCLNSLDISTTAKFLTPRTVIFYDIFLSVQHLEKPRYTVVYQWSIGQDSDLRGYFPAEIENSLEFDSREKQKQNSRKFNRKMDREFEFEKTEKMEKLLVKI